MGMKCRHNWLDKLLQHSESIIIDNSVTHVTFGYSVICLGTSEYIIERWYNNEVIIRDGVRFITLKPLV